MKHEGFEYLRTTSENEIYASITEFGFICTKPNSAGGLASDKQNAFRDRTYLASLKRRIRSQKYVVESEQQVSSGDVL